MDPALRASGLNENKPQALILTPTRELALQVNEDITNIGRFKRIKATPLLGNILSHTKAELKQRTHMVVGTLTCAGPYGTRIALTGADCLSRH